MLVCAIPVILLPTRTIILCEVLGSFVTAIVGDVSVSQGQHRYHHQHQQGYIEIPDLVSHWLHQGQSGRPRSYSDPSFLVSNIDDDEAKDGDNGEVAWERPQQRLFSQGSSISSPPVFEVDTRERNINDATDYGLWGIEASW
jgi:hypothetical protein